MKLRTLVVIASILFVACSSGGGGGGPAPDVPSIETWDVVKSNCDPSSLNNDIITCYENGDFLDLDNVPGNATFIWWFLVDRPNVDVLSLTARIDFRGLEAMPPTSYSISFPGGQEGFDLVEVFWTLTASGVSCGDYELFVYFNYANGSSTPTLRVPFTVTTDCSPPAPLPAASMTIEMANGTAFEGSDAEGMEGE